MHCPSHQLLLRCSGPDGQAMVESYDLLIGAEHESGALLVAEALAELEQRRDAHKHPSSSSSSRNSVAGAAAAALRGKPVPAVAAALHEEGQHQPIYSSPAAAAASSALAAAVLSPPEQVAKPAAVPATKAAAGAAGFVELEFKSWHDMPHQKELKALLPASHDSLRDSLDEVG